MADKPAYDDPIRIGDRAPDFRVAAVNRDGDIGLADYTGRRSLLLGLFRGLHCPFCRRQVVQMGGYSERLGELGVDALAIINTELARARVYYGRQRPGMALAVDPDWDTHRRYGLSRRTGKENRSAALYSNSFAAQARLTVSGGPLSLAPHPARMGKFCREAWWRDAGNHLSRPGLAAGRHGTRPRRRLRVGARRVR